MEERLEVKKKEGEVRDRERHEKGVVEEYIGRHNYIMVFF